MLEKTKRRERITASERQKIIREHAMRQPDGEYHCDVFFKEVLEAGSDHPAYGWFEWDTDKCFLEYNLERARQFAQGLKQRFEVAELDISNVRAEFVEVPFALASLEKRNRGGGHMLATNSPEFWREAANQAHMELDSWVRKWSGTAEYFGVDLKPFRKALSSFAEGRGA